MIEAADGIVHHVLDEEAREALERQTMRAGAQTFLDGADGALQFADETVGEDYVEFDGKRVERMHSNLWSPCTSRTLKRRAWYVLMMARKRRRIKARFAIGDGMGRAETDASRDGM